MKVEWNMNHALEPAKEYHCCPHGVAVGHACSLCEP